MTPGDLALVVWAISIVVGIAAGIGAADLPLWALYVTRGVFIITSVVLLYLVLAEVWVRRKEPEVKV